MASYNIDKRDPLLDTQLQALLNRRGRELLGLFVLVLVLPWR